MRGIRPLALMSAIAASAALLTAGAATAVPAACTYPAEVLDLTRWKVQLPVDDPNQSGTQVLQVTRPRLNTYVLSPWFKPTSSCNGVQFRAAVNGVKTPNTTYARSELREMQANGTTEAKWSSDSGTHTLVIDQAINRLPNTKPHLIAGQIHDGDDRSTFRLDGKALYITRDNDTRYKLVNSNYVLGTRFQAKFVVSNGSIKAYYNGVLQTTIPVSFTTGYFKAGAYTLANCDNSSPCNTGNYGQTTIYGLSVSHS
ncbi:polysaccharide lyase family 7 protein [Kribbella sp. CA-294648]|uniref:polysaccharide lyase family 7 protein n=1 Tax=Kribbella sp. CA-294648 TaxID=3239948 RepID=UPI003D8E3A46